MSAGDDGFIRVSGEMLRRSRHLSMVILGITLFTCILFLAATRYLDLPIMFHGSMGTSAVILAWINRRAISDAGRFWSVIRDPRLLHLRSTVIGMIVADAISLIVSLATGIRLLADVFLRG